MPLNPDTLALAIRKITDKDCPGWGGFPADDAAVKARWSAALRDYFSELVLPSLLPGALDAGEAAARAALVPAAGPLSLPLAAQAFAGALVAFTAPYVATPPPGVAVLPLLPPTVDAVTPAAAIASVLDAWTRTGTWTLPTPASGVWA